MKKLFFIVFFMMATIVIADGATAQAATELYTNQSIKTKEYEDKELQTVSFVVYDGFGYRNEFTYELGDTEKDIYEKEFKFGYDYGYYYAQLLKAGEDPKDHVFYMFILYDGVTAICVRTDADELFKELTDFEKGLKNDSNYDI